MQDLPILSDWGKVLLVVALTVVMASLARRRERDPRR